MIRRLSEEAVVSIHKDMLKDTGGSDGIRDMGLLKSALNNPFQTFAGEELYPSILTKASMICRSVILNHPFVDGNKRTGIHCMLLFLGRNNIRLEYTQQELIELGLSVAEGIFNAENIHDWISAHLK